MCFWRHKWGKWSKVTVVGIVGIPGEKALVQERYCDTCGEYQRKQRHDGGT
jgi:hypothetical protein